MQGANQYTNFCVNDTEIKPPRDKVAEVMQVDQTTILRTVENIKNGQLSIFDKTFTPYLYNIWNQQVPQRTITNIINFVKNGQLSFFYKTFTVYLYNKKTRTITGTGIKRGS